MINILQLTGILILVISFMIGLGTGNLFYIAASMLGGFATSMIFFALARIIENQEKLLNPGDDDNETDDIYNIYETANDEGTAEPSEPLNKCPACGADITPGDKICPECGLTLED